MKRFAMLALLLSFGLVTVGCKPAEKKADAPAMEGTPAAAPDAGAPAGEEKKAE